MLKVTGSVLSALACAALACAGEFEVPLSVQEAAGVARKAEPISGGVPLPKGKFKKDQAFALFKNGGAEVPCQAVPLVVVTLPEVNTSTPSTLSVVASATR